MMPQKLVGGFLPFSEVLQTIQGRKFGGNFVGFGLGPQKVTREGPIISSLLLWSELEAQQSCLCQLRSAKVQL